MHIRHECECYGHPFNCYGHPTNCPCSKTSDKDARIAELEKLLLEARTFMEDDFPPIPASQLTFEQCCVTPRYFEFWKALHKTLSL